ncbi:MAG: hypothetical protein MZV70_72385 [Desulfobacterales bacterium]|nr:hypothetical protein [Desulfobacterales bacterium]
MSSGLAVTYAALGAVAALSGRLFGQMQTTPLIYFIMANICLIMGLSMLDVFKISIPIPQRMMKYSGGGKKGFIPSFLLGAASGFVIGPCTAPVLAVLLGYVALQTNVIMGIGLLVCFCLRHGHAVDSGRNVCRIYFIPSPIGGLDDYHHKGFRRYFDWCGRIFPVYCGHAVFLVKEVSCKKQFIFSLL